MTRRHAFTLLELIMMAAVGLILLAPLLTLSSRTLEVPRELLARRMAEELCQSLVERLEGYKIWLDPLGTLASGPAYPPLPTWALATPLETRPGVSTLADTAYREQLARVGVELTPTVERVRAERPGLFRLTVRVRYRTASREGEVEVSRYCYAP